MARFRTPESIQAVITGKILATELLDDDEIAVLSTDAMTVANAADEILWSKHWHEISTGEWEGERRIMTITWVDSSPATQIRTQSDGSKRFTRVFRERVDSSIVYVETESVPSGGALRAAMRRTGSGELISQITSVGSVHSGPAVEEQIRELERRIWEIAGM